MHDKIRARLAREGLFDLKVIKRYDDKGARMTDCCGATSQHDEDGVLFCTACFDEVKSGEGDGTETKN